MSCRFCAQSVTEVLNLGLQPPSNALLQQAQDPERVYPLAVGVCWNCHLLQTTFDILPDEIFNDDYPYVSGQSQGWVDHCREFAAEISKRLGLGPTSVVVEIGGNDGTLLKHFACKTLNVEPSGVAALSEAAGIQTHKGWWEGIKLSERADLIVGNNVLAHTLYPNEFVRTIKANLKGIATFEFPWALMLLKFGQFDTIYHEHYSYLSLTALIPLFAKHGLTIVDVEAIPTHGGSLRIYVVHEGLPAAAVYNLLALEEPLTSPQIYRDFRQQAQAARKAFSSFVKENGGIYAYGAAAKGTTLINWCGLNSDDIKAVGDTTRGKQGKFLPGSHIPIVSEEEIVARQPPVVAILPWNWRKEIIAKLRPLMPATRFVTAIPSLETL